MELKPRKNICISSVIKIAREKLLNAKVNSTSKAIIFSNSYNYFEELLKAKVCELCGQTYAER